MYWMQKFEKNIGLQNRQFRDVLFIDFKMLQFFKVIIQIRSIFEEPDGKGLNKYIIS